MAIESICQGCGRKLRAADEHAGKQARCPKCRTTYTVPAAVAPSSLRGAGGPEAGGWYLETDGGQTYGPVSRSELDEWVNQGRVIATSRVRREGGMSQPAVDLYPFLAEKKSAPPQSNPFAEQTQSNPYASPEYSKVPTTAPAPAHQVSHRGASVLILGILALCCNICFIPGICAWVMGNADLKQMNAGLMDPSGRGITQVGMVLGIIGTVIGGIGIVVQILMALAEVG